MPMATGNGVCFVGYNGGLHEPSAHWQILGNGVRVFNSVLLRFHSPDALSPFEIGGYNAYAYGQNDPANHVDPTGHFAQYVAAGAFGLGVLSAVGAVASHFSKDETARNIFGAVALGAFTVSALAAAAYLVPRTLSPKVHGQEPVGRLKPMPQGYARVYQAKDGTHVLDAHGLPGTVNLHGRTVGPDVAAQYVRKAAGTTPIKRVQVQSCHGADLGERSFAAGLAKELGAPVMAFEGPVKVTRKRLVYKMGFERYFLPDGSSAKRATAAPANPWRSHKPRFPLNVRDLRNGARR